MVILSKKKKDLEFYSCFFDNNSDGSCVFNSSKVIIIKNKKMDDFLSNDISLDSSNINILDCFKLQRTIERAPTFNDEIASIFLSPVSTKLENYKIQLRNSNSFVPVSFRISPFIVAKKQYFLLTIIDKSHQTQRNQSQDSFISSMSHEMRTPIATIKGYLELALNKELSTIDENAEKYITSAYSSVESLSDFFKSLLIASRIDSNIVQVNSTVLDVLALIKKYCDENTIIAQKKDIKIVTDFERESLFCRLDQSYFREIFTNLISNAIKYTNSGGEINVSCKKINSKVCIAISDTGIGIAPEDVDNIFKKFYRASGEARNQQGSGLGLYLVKRQVELMDGKISVESELGHGSTFTVLFPLVDFDNVSSNLTVEEFTPMTIEEIEKYDNFTKLKYLRVSENIFTRNYIDLSKKWTRGEIPSATDEEKKRVYNITRKFNSDVPQNKFDSVWAKFRPKLDNVGLARILKFVGSRIAIPWILNAPSASSWDIAFGYGYDFEGKWTKVSKDDVVRWVIAKDPQLMWIRQRTILARKEIQDKDSVLFLKAGLLPELRHIDGMGMPNTIYACEDENGINADDIFGWSASQNNVEYVHNDIIDYLDKLNIENKKFDTIIMNGGAYSNYKDLDKIIPASIDILKSGGKFMFDLQPIQWDTDLMSYVLGAFYTDENNAPKDVNTAINYVTKICADLPGIRIKYTVDKRNEKPAGIMFYIEKLD